MASGKYNLKIEQGAEYRVRFTWTDNDRNPVDVTGYTGQIQFRYEKEDTDPIYDSSISGDVTVGGTDGIIDFSLSTTQTEAFDFDNCLYDLQLTKDGEDTRLVEGRVYLSKEVTR